MMQSHKQEITMPLYLITSPSGKQYVGITTLTVNRRMTGHKTAARLGSPYPLHAAIRKYGFDAMWVDVLHTSRDIHELHALEIDTIAAFNTQAPNGYNLTAGGEGTTNHLVTLEQRENLSNCMIARWGDPDFVLMRKKSSSDTAKNQTSEHRSKFIDAGRKYWTPEKYAERAAVVGPKQKAMWSNPNYRAENLPRIIERNKSDAMRESASKGAKLTRAKQTPERRREIAQLAVVARAAKRAEIEALPTEERDRIKAELCAAKSVATKAGRAAAKAKRTPEEEVIVRERYRQAAIKRHALKKEAQC